MDVDVLDGGEFVEYFLRSMVLPRLQVAVEQEAHGEEFPEENVDVRRRAVGVDRFLPQSQPSENVRWDLQRVRRRRRDRWVAARHVEPVRGYGRVVIGVDQIMHRAGMIGMLGKGLFKNCGSL